MLATSDSVDRPPTGWPSATRSSAFLGEPGAQAEGFFVSEALALLCWPKQPGPVDDRPPRDDWRIPSEAQRQRLGETLCKATPEGSLLTPRRARRF